ncbi:YdcF family protein [Phreatobacter aquaticus]|uniref:YdcF family protein n=1 Tax=Phreatobacter aquaticus TaxID=2570229 RepID=A0A4D7QQ34_9HYPH|nr:YdcF family protein [Phreatobacter aquaticus]QCK87736.1 YdcF family protein [Phreatobacter aquaticus]
MFFYLSKIVWWVAAPSNVLIGFVLIGAVLLFTRWSRSGRRMVAFGALGLLVCGMAPVGIMLARPLEARFPVLSQEMAPPTGIIVLGGSIDQITTAARGGQVVIGAAGSRITEAAALAHRYPQARLVFTGGSNALFAQDAEDEAAAAARLFAQMGIATARITIERESRNTWENAVLTKAMVKPQPGERWLLVTSAWHMPRSVGIFRVAGFDVIPYPVDFESRNTDREIRRPVLPMSRGLDLVDRMAREWLGLLAYRVGGRTDALFPAPGPARP